MRLDLYLKAGRIVLRRSLAQKLCTAGLVKVNKLTAKPSREVKPNDEIEVISKNRKLLVKVLQLPEKKQVSREEAGKLFQVLAEETLEETAFSPTFESQ